MLIENNDNFLSELTLLFEKSRTSKGKSIYLTMKRYDGRIKPKPKSEKNPTQTSEYKCLIRASLGKKKISTVISARDVNKFQLAYANLLKGNLIGLKKRDTKKKSGGKSKATQ